MSEPRVDEFVEFLELLTDEAPPEYEPWLFRVEAGSKAPDISFGSWKKERARLSKADAVKWMEAGNNVGIAGRPDGPLINVDIDDEDETSADDLKPTLIARSRSRTGVHAWYFEAPGADVPNISTDDAGEVRANWQYVVAPGSYVETAADNVPDDERDDAGYYTVERDDPVTSLRPDELPDVFLDENAPDPEQQEVTTPDAEPTTTDGNRSAVFEIEAPDVVRKEGGNTNVGDRWTSLFHGSDTGKNMSLSDEGLLHCWRHEVAHNGLQALAVLSDYHGRCKDIGSAHKHSDAGQSCFRKEDGAHIWHAWKYAKKNGYIPEDDPVPYSALKHLCRARDLCAISELPSAPDETIPAAAYDAALSTIENHDELNPGRKKTDAISGGGKNDAEGAETDGGATAAADGASDGAESDVDDDDSDNPEGWERVYGMYASADDADERLPARFEATELLDTVDYWRCVYETDRLWRYDPQAGLYRDNGESQAREALVDGLREQFKAHEHSEICEQLRGRHTVREQQMGGPDGAVLTENCVLEIDRDGIDTRDATPDDEFLGRVETEYDPSADCPRFKSFLKESLETGSDRKKVQEFAGYCLMHWGLPHHKSLFLVGPTASGKSTFLDTIRSMLGSDAVASLTPQQMVGERFGGAELYGAWANIRNDIPASTIEDVGQFKEIVGGDPIKAEQKYEDPFMFEPTAKHAFSANQLPDAEVDDEAFFRRILLVPFPDTVPRGERDPQLDEKLEAELPGVLNWALDGLQRLLKQGRFTADRTPAETQRTWERWGNSVDRFRETCLEEAEGNALPKGDLYSAYVAFCADEGIPKDTQNKMTRAIKQEGFEDGREYVDGERQRVLYGLDWSGRGEEYRPDGGSGSTPTGLGDH